MGTYALLSLIPFCTVFVTCIRGIVRERRLRERDRMAFALGRHIFDQTRNPNVLVELASFEKPGNPIKIKPVLEAPPTADSS